jgi:hypothetical protein
MAKSTEHLTPRQARTQQNKILAYLESGKTLTQLEALKLFGSFRLGARIFNLRKEGAPIVSEMVQVGRKLVAEYRLEESQAPMMNEATDSNDEFIA